jgi:hypothetical protein
MQEEVEVAHLFNQLLRVVGGMAAAEPELLQA